MGGNGAGRAGNGCERQALALAAFRQAGRGLGQLGGKHPVHAAVDTGIHPRDRCSLRNQLGGLGLILLLLFAHGVGDVVGDRIDRTFGRSIEHRIALGIRRLDGVEHVFLLAEIDLRLLPRHLEMIPALLDHFPERHVRVVAMLRHVDRRHLERIGLQLERALAAEEGFPSQRIDFRDLFVGHGVAAARRAVAMHHQLRAGASQRLVEGVGVAGIERQIEGRLRVHLRRADGIEAFRRLAVAFPDLGSEVARPAADRIGLQQREAAGAILLPDFEFGFLLEDPDQHRRLQVHVLRRHVGDQFRRDRLVGLGVVRQRDLVAVAAGQQHTGRERGRGDERANQRAINQGRAPHPKDNFKKGNSSAIFAPQT